MENERFIVAIGRIERALSRIELGIDSAKNNATDAGLAERHENLKQQTETALSMIDSILLKRGS